MKIQDCNLRAYEVYLQSIPLSRVGIDRLTQVASCPNGDLTDDVQPIFGAFCEFVIFNECVKRPFFEILGALINNRVGDLFSVLLAKDSATDSSLTYKEAFDFFLLIGKNQTRDILDAYKCSSYTYNGVLDAIGNKDCEAFLSALGSADYQDMMATLWKLRYILLGIKSSKAPDKRGIGRIEDLNQWLKGADFSAYFKAYTSAFAEGFVEKRIKSLASLAIPEKPRRMRITRNLNDDELLQLYSTTATADGSYYPEWIDKFTRMSFEQPCFASYLAEVANREKEIAADSDTISHLIIKMAVDGHKAEVIQHFGIDPNNANDGNDNWDDYYCDYHNIDILGEYIILYTGKMLSVYDDVKEILSDEEKCIIEWVLSCSRYTGIFKQESSETVNVEPVTVDNTADERPLPPPDIQNRKRLRNSTLINTTCQYLQGWFKGANIKDIKFVFFGIGERPSKSLELTTQKSNLCLFISYLIGKKNIQKETWIHFAFCINFRGKPVFPTDPDDKAWVSNPPSGLAKAKDKEEYENSGFRLILENSLNRKLTKEEQEDVK